MIVEGQGFFNESIRTQESLNSDSVEFRSCTFEACTVAVKQMATEHLRIRNVSMRACSVAGGGLRGVWLSDCHVDGARLSGTVTVLGCIFERVTVSGPMRRLFIRDDYSFLSAASELEAEAKDAYRHRISMALDISRLSCQDLDIRGVPARLIRIDPDSHFVIARSALPDVDWRQLDFSGTSYGASLALLENSDWEDVILTVPSGQKEQRAREVLAVLKDADLIARHVQPG